MCVRERAFDVYPLPLPLLSLPSAISRVANKRPYGADKKSPSLFTLLRQRKETGDGQTKHHLRRNITHTVLTNILGPYNACNYSASNDEYITLLESFISWYEHDLSPACSPCFYQ